jgi:hypothetical protein
VGAARLTWWQPSVPPPFAQLRGKREDLTCGHVWSAPFGPPPQCFLALVPLHPAEVQLQFTEGTDTLIAALDRGDVSELLDPARPSNVGPADRGARPSKSSGVGA